MGQTDWEGTGGDSRALVKLCQALVPVLLGAEEFDRKVEDSLVKVLNCNRRGNILTLHDELRRNKVFLRKLIRILIYATGLEKLVDRMLEIDPLVGTAPTDDIEFVKHIVSLSCSLVDPDSEWKFDGSEDEQWLKICSCVIYLDLCLK